MAWVSLKASALGAPGIRCSSPTSTSAARIAGAASGRSSLRPYCLRTRGRREALYVSATPTENTVDFYLNRGCMLAPEPDTKLLAAEPEDIHLLYLL